MKKSALGVYESKTLAVSVKLMPIRQTINRSEEMTSYAMTDAFDCNVLVHCKAIRDD